MLLSNQMLKQSMIKTFEQRRGKFLEVNGICREMAAIGGPLHGVPYPLPWTQNILQELRRELALTVMYDGGVPYYCLN
jgi:hypothetical protein